MSTKVIYNGVTLENVSTREWRETVELDESGTDQIGVRYQLTFDAIVHQQALPVYSSHIYSDDGGSYSTPAQRLVAIKAALMTHRRELQVWFGESQVLLAKPITGQGVNVDGRTDINNGPSPMGCEITHVASDRVFRIRWSVAVVLRGCNLTYAEGDARFAINNRWSVRESMDESFRITRTISGTLRLAGSPAQSNALLPQAFRSLCFPGLEDGFKRASVSFQAEKSGLALSYEIIDRQARYAPPYPAIDMSGTHRAETSDGVNFVLSVSVRLQGPPHCDARQLIQRAVQVCQYRLNWEEGQGAEDQLSSSQSLITHASISESIGEVPEVEVSIAVKVIGATGHEALTKVRDTRFGTLELPPLAFVEDGVAGDVTGSEYQVNKFPMPALWGTDEWAGARSPLALAFVRCVLQAPCSGAQAIGVPATTQSEVGQRYNRDRYNDTSVSADPDATYLEEADLAGTYSDGHFAAQYVTVSAAAGYTWRQPTVALPVANAAAGTNAQTCTIVQLGAPTSERTFTVDYERLDQPPELPPFRNHKVGASNFAGTMLDVEIMPPRLSAAGDRTVHRIRATYSYIADRPVNPHGIVNVGRLPTMAPERVESTAQLSQIFNESLDA